MYPTVKPSRIAATCRSPLRSISRPALLYSTLNSETKRSSHRWWSHELMLTAHWKSWQESERERCAYNQKDWSRFRVTQWNSVGTFSRPEWGEVWQQSLNGFCQLWAFAVLYIVDYDQKYCTVRVHYYWLNNCFLMGFVKLIILLRNCFTYYSYIAEILDVDPYNTNRNATSSSYAFSYD